ncbi:MAG: class I SAM-dependent methyltransferase [Promethearchaeota archaeon]
MLDLLIQDCDSLLDLGCGMNSPLSKLKKRNNRYSLGVDIYEKYIEISKRRNIHNDYLLLDILEIDKKVPPKSFDCVLLIDVIEHLEKLDGIKILKKSEKIALKKIIIFTPNGFLHQKKYHNNIFQIHKSGWDFRIFKKLKYRVFGINGLKFIRGEKSNIKYRPIKFWYLVSKISNKFVKFFPQFAFHLLCIKEV